MTQCSHTKSSRRLFATFGVVGERKVRTSIFLNKRGEERGIYIKISLHGVHSNESMKKFTYSALISLLVTRTRIWIAPGHIHGIIVQMTVQLVSRQHLVFLLRKRAFLHQFVNA